MDVVNAEDFKDLKPQVVITNQEIPPPPPPNPPVCPPTNVSPKTPRTPGGGKHPRFYPVVKEGTSTMIDPQVSLVY